MSGGAPSPGSLRSALAVAGLLIAARVLVMARSPLALFHPEEYVHLRLARQLDAGLGLGPVGPWMYGSGSGIDGGGALLNSALHLLTSPLLGTGEAAVRALALLWFAGLLAVCGGWAHRQWGGGGALAVMVGFALLPPPFTVHSCLAWGTHAEGAALTVALILAMSRAVAGSTWAAVAAGALAAVAPWAWPVAWPAVGIALGWGLWAGEARQRAAILGGLMLGVGVWAAFGVPSAARAEVWVQGALHGLRLPGLGELARWFVVPAGSYGWDGRWSPPAGAGAALDIAFSVLGWAVLVAWARREPVGRVALASAVAVAVGLGWLGQSAPRRLMLSYPLFALAVGSLLARWQGPRGRAASWGLVALGLAPSVLLGVGPAQPRPPFPLAEVALCPRSEPVLETEPCAQHIEPALFPLLGTILEDPSPEARTARLTGVRGVTVDLSTWALWRTSGRCPQERSPEMWLAAVPPSQHGVALEAARAAREALCSQ